jgi:uncharacterized protein YfaT (DUF1175 family)
MSAHDKGFSIVTWSLQALLPDFTLNASSRESLRSPDSLVFYSWFTFIFKSQFNEFPDSGERRPVVKLCSPYPRLLSF